MFVCKNLLHCNFNLLLLKLLPWKDCRSLKEKISPIRKWDWMICLPKKVWLITRFLETNVGPCKSSMKNHSLFWKESSIIDVWEEAENALANIRFVSLRSLLWNKIYVSSYHLPLFFKTVFKITSHTLSSKNELPYRVFYFFCDLKLVT